MISGMYMGEIARQVIVKLVEAGSLFDGYASEKLKTPMAFLTKYISEIERYVIFCIHSTVVHRPFIPSDLLIEFPGLQLHV